MALVEAVSAEVGDEFPDLPGQALAEPVVPASGQEGFLLGFDDVAVAF